VQASLTGTGTLLGLKKEIVKVGKFKCSYSACPPRFLDLRFNDLRAFLRLLNEMLRQKINEEINTNIVMIGKKKRSNSVIRLQHPSPINNKTTHRTNKLKATHSLINR